MRVWFGKLTPHDDARASSPPCRSGPARRSRRPPPARYRPSASISPGSMGFWGSATITAAVSGVTAPVCASTRGDTSNPWRSNASLAWENPFASMSERPGSPWPSSTATRFLRSLPTRISALVSSCSLTVRILASCEPLSTTTVSYWVIPYCLAAAGWVSGSMASPEILELWRRYVASRSLNLVSGSLPFWKNPVTLTSLPSAFRTLTVWGASVNAPVWERSTWAACRTASTLTITRMAPTSAVINALFAPSRVERRFSHAASSTRNSTPLSTASAAPAPSTARPYQRPGYPRSTPTPTTPPRPPPPPTPPARTAATPAAAPTRSLLTINRPHRPAAYRHRPESSTRCVRNRPNPVTLSVYTTLAESSSPLRKRSRCWLIERCSSTGCTVVLSAVIAAQPITQNPRMRPSVTMPALIWFSVNEDARRPIARYTPPTSSRPR